MNARIRMHCTVIGLCIFALACSNKSPEMGKAVPALDRIPVGYRAMAIPIQTWQAQFIKTGDRVDLIVSFGKDFPVRSKVGLTQTLLQNVLVLDVRSPIDTSALSALELGLNPNEAQMLVAALDGTKLHVLLRGQKDVEMHPMAMTDCRKLFR